MTAAAHAPTSPAPTRWRRRTIRRAAEVPAALVDEMLGAMIRAIDRTPEAQRCAGLSFAFVMTDRRMPPARYEVAADGAVRLRRGSIEGSTFVFSGESDAFDAVLSGRASATLALLRRRIRLRGSYGHILDLLQMLPVLQTAYVDCRDRVCRRHAARYTFEFA